MRAKRYMLAIAMIMAGAVVARTDDMLPFAARLAGPLLPQSRPLEMADAGQLPNYVNTRHDLTFANPAPAGDETAAPAPAPGEARTVPSSEAPTAAASPAPAQITPMVGDDSQADGMGGMQGENGPGDVTAAEAVPADAIPAGMEPAELSKDAAPDAAAPARDAGAGQTGVATVTIEPDTPESAPPARPLIAAKTLFGKVKGPSLLQARAIGTYARGCLAGGVALPVDGPAWQAMRLSRNRNWGHPKLVDLVERLAVTAQKDDGWRGLLVGDLAQPRGGPMLTGHASHQLGLDADVWLTEMPDRKLTKREREDMSATSMLDKTDLAVDPNIFTEKHVRLLKRAASYPEVERVLVHPAIKKALCQAAGPDRGWLGKVRPIQGHYYHFHIRIGCPIGSVDCKPQKPVTGEDGCAKEVDEWLERLARAKLPPPPKPPGWKPAPRAPPAPPLVLTQLPSDCRMVLESGEDGIEIPAAALVGPPPPRSARAGAHAREAKAAGVVLKPVKERRAAAGKREARAGH